MYKFLLKEKNVFPKNLQDFRVFIVTAPGYKESLRYPRLGLMRNEPGMNQDLSRGFPG